MATENLDKTCREIIETLYRHPAGLGFNELRKKGNFNRKTLNKHLYEHLTDRFVECIGERLRGKKLSYRLTPRGVSSAFRTRSQNYGKLAMSKWAQDWLNEGWDPIDVTSLVMEAPKEGTVYLMRHTQRREAELVVSPFLDASMYLKRRGGHPISLVPDIFTKTDLAITDTPTLVSKLVDFIKREAPIEAGLDPGQAYKRFLGTLREWSSSLRYVGGPIPFSKEIYQETHKLEDTTVKPLAISYGETILRQIENPLKSGIYFTLMQHHESHQPYGFWVILNQDQQKLLSSILEDPAKAARFGDIFLKRLKSFIQDSFSRVLEEKEA